LFELAVNGKIMWFGSFNKKREIFNTS